MVMAEKRRLLKTNQRVKKAHFQTSLDRAKAQIIAQKAKESQEKDEMLRRMMQKSDEQLKELRDRDQSSEEKDNTLVYRSTFLRLRH